MATSRLSFRSNLDMQDERIQNLSNPRTGTDGEQDAATRDYVDTAIDGFEGVSVSDEGNFQFFPTETFSIPNATAVTSVTLSKDAKPNSTITAIDSIVIDGFDQAEFGYDGNFTVSDTVNSDGSQDVTITVPVAIYGDDVSTDANLIDIATSAGNTGADGGFFDTMGGDVRFLFTSTSINTSSRYYIVDGSDRRNFIGPYSGITSVNITADVPNEYQVDVPSIESSALQIANPWLTQQSLNNNVTISYRDWRHGDILIIEEDASYMPEMAVSYEYEIPWADTITIGGDSYYINTFIGRGTSLPRTSEDKALFILTEADGDMSQGIYQWANDQWNFAEEDVLNFISQTPGSPDVLGNSQTFTTGTSTTTNVILDARFGVLPQNLDIGSFVSLDTANILTSVPDNPSLIVAVSGDRASFDVDPPLSAAPVAFGGVRVYEFIQGTDQTVTISADTDIGGTLRADNYLLTDGRNVFGPLSGVNVVGEPVVGETDIIKFVGPDTVAWERDRSRYITDTDEVEATPDNLADASSLTTSGGSTTSNIRLRSTTPVPDNIGIGSVVSLTALDAIPANPSFITDIASDRESFDLDPPLASAPGFFGTVVVYNVEEGDEAVPGSITITVDAEFEGTLNGEPIPGVTTVDTTTITGELNTFANPATYQPVNGSYDALLNSYEVGDVITITSPFAVSYDVTILAFTGAAIDIENAGVSLLPDMESSAGYTTPVERINNRGGQRIGLDLIVEGDTAVETNLTVGGTTTLSAPGFTLPTGSDVTNIGVNATGDIVAGTSGEVGDITGVAVTAPITGGGTTGDVTIGLADTAVTAGTYGGLTTYPSFTVDAQGRITAAESLNLTFEGAAVRVVLNGTTTTSIEAGGIGWVDATHQYYNLTGGAIAIGAFADAAAAITALEANVNFEQVGDGGGGGSALTLVTEDTDTNTVTVNGNLTIEDNLYISDISANDDEQQLDVSEDVADYDISIATGNVGSGSIIDLSTTEGRAIQNALNSTGGTNLKLYIAAQNDDIIQNEVVTAAVEGPFLTVFSIAEGSDASRSSITFEETVDEDDPVFGTGNLVTYTWFLAELRSENSILVRSNVIFEGDVSGIVNRPERYSYASEDTIDWDELPSSATDEDVTAAYADPFHTARVSYRGHIVIIDEVTIDNVDISDSATSHTVFTLPEAVVSRLREPDPNTTDGLKRVGLHGVDEPGRALGAVVPNQFVNRATSDGGLLYDPDDVSGPGGTNATVDADGNTRIRIKIFYRVRDNVNEVIGINATSDFVADFLDQGNRAQIAEITDITNVALAEIAQTYDATSVLAQSGTAVAEAIATISTDGDQFADQAALQNFISDKPTFRNNIAAAQRPVADPASANSVIQYATDGTPSYTTIPPGSTVDATFDPTSANPQAGTAVQDALEIEVGIRTNPSSTTHTRLQHEITIAGDATVDSNEDYTAPSPIAMDSDIDLTVRITVESFSSAAGTIHIDLTHNTNADIESIASFSIADLTDQGIVTLETVIDGADLVAGATYDVVYRTVGHGASNSITFISAVDFEFDSGGLFVKPEVDDYIEGLIESYGDGTRQDLRTNYLTGAEIAEHYLSGIVGHNDGTLVLVDGFNPDDTNFRSGSDAYISDGGDRVQVTFAFANGSSREQDFHNGKIFLIQFNDGEDTPTNSIIYRARVYFNNVSFPGQPVEIYANLIDADNNLINPLSAVSLTDSTTVLAALTALSNGVNSGNSLFDNTQVTLSLDLSSDEPFFEPSLQFSNLYVEEINGFRPQGGTFPSKFSLFFGTPSNGSPVEVSLLGGAQTITPEIYTTAGDDWYWWGDLRIQSAVIFAAPTNPGMWTNGPDPDTASIRFNLIG